MIQFETLKDYSFLVLEELEHGKEEERKLGKHDKEEKNKQEGQLVNQIAYNVLSLKGRIALFNNECAFGKSYVALKGAVKYIAYSEKHMFDGVLFVCELKKDCEDNAERLNKWYKEYAGAEENVAIAIDPASMKRKEIKQYLIEYSFVFITHSKYRRLILNSADRYIYTRSRNLLIIDEYIDFVQPVEFSRTYNALLRKDIMELGKDKAVKIYDKITYELNNEINRLDRLRDKAREEKDTALKPKQYDFFNATTDIKEIRKLIGELTKVIKKTSSKGKLMEYQRNNDWISIFDKINQLENFYLGTSVELYFTNEHTKKKEQLICVPSYHLKPFFLKNSVLLDASAELNKIYEYQPNIYRLVPQKKIFDHSNFTIKQLHINATKRGQTKYINYEKASRKIIKELRNETDGDFEKTLVVTIKDRCKNNNDEPVYIYQEHDEELSVAYYEIIKSNNDFKDFQNCFLETLYMPQPHIVILQYLYYTGERFKIGDIDVTFGNDNSVGKFRNDELEEIRRYDIANLSYQAIKRINRNIIIPKCNIVWNCHYDEVVKLVSKMMLNCKVERDITMEQYYKKKPKEIDENSRVGQVTGLFNDVLNNNIPKELQDKCIIDENTITFQKKDIYTFLDMTRTQFSNLINHKEIIKLALQTERICYIISKDKQINVTDDNKCNNRQIKFIIKSS